MVCVMVFAVFVFGVLAGIVTAALVWAGASSAVVLAGFGVLLLLCALLSSVVAMSDGAKSDSEDEDQPGFRTDKAR